MSGTKEGGMKVSERVKKEFGEDFYRKIGAIGGRKSRGGGFASMSPERVRELGRKGGLKSRKVKKIEVRVENE